MHSSLRLFTATEDVAVRKNYYEQHFIILIHLWFAERDVFYYPVYICLFLHLNKMNHIYTPVSSSLDTRRLPQSLHRPRPSPSSSLRRLSDHFSRFFRDSTCSLQRFISSKKPSSTSRVISYMAALKTVSMTPESWDWKVAIVSAITLIKRDKYGLFSESLLQEKFNFLSEAVIRQPLYCRRFLKNV